MKNFKTLVKTYKLEKVRQGKGSHEIYAIGDSGRTVSFSNRVIKSDKQALMHATKEIEAKLKAA